MKEEELLFMKSWLPPGERQERATAMALSVCPESCQHTARLVQAPTHRALV